MAAATIHRSGRLVCVVLAMAVCAASGAKAFDGIDFVVTGGDEDLTDLLRGASVLMTAKRTKQTDAQDLFADARAEYASLLNALYAAGHYSAVIHVYVDGREAADIPPLDAPSQISRIKVAVDPGPRFTFSQARIRPLAGDTVLPEGFAVGRRAESGRVLAAVGVAVDGWRAKGHAKVQVTAQDVVANHPTAQLSADVTLNPGPRLRFGPLTVKGQERMRERRIRKIAGLPEGKTYDPAEIDRAESRLRRTGVFKSATLTEDDQITPPDLLGMTATVVEQKPRRYSFGAELASDEGLMLSGGWLHRNLAGGGERLELGAEVTNIGSGSSGVDYVFSLSLDRPATFTPDTTLGFDLELGRLNEVDFAADVFSIATSLSHVFSDSLSGSAGLSYEYAKVTDSVGDLTYRHLALPIGLTWDKRDSKTDATKGFYLDAEVKPFLGFGITDSGLRATADLRAYKPFGAEKGLVLAGRLQVGSIFGASLIGAPRDDLFYSGGGGTVRGQPYQSLGIPVLRSAGVSSQFGGTNFIAASVEARVKASDKIGVVGFVDVGRVDVDGFFSDIGDWHAGAGLGLRYATGVGPIRVDIAGPVGGKTGDGIQIYVGLGQAF